MKDFVVYHNPDSMKVPVTQVNAKAIVTDKSVHNVEGSRVWLITGEGTPRKFSLRSYFIVDQVDDATESGFKTKLSGKVGEIFDPMISLDREPWFRELKRENGNFAFGFQSIKEERIIKGLELLAKI